MMPTQTGATQTPGEELRPHLRRDVVLRSIDGEFIAYDPISDRLQLLNAAAMAVLGLCDGMLHSGEIAALLRCSSPGPEAVETVEKLIEYFDAEGLLEWKSEVVRENEPAGWLE